MSKKATEATAVTVKEVLVKDVAEKYGWSPVEANNILMAGVKEGCVKLTGTRKTEGKKGKPANVFEVGEKIEIAVKTENGRITVSELAAQKDWSPLMANLVLAKSCKVVDHIKIEGKKGKPANVFEVGEKIEITMG